MIKLIAFDVFGTVFDLSSIDRNEIKEYVKHVHQSQWEPLNLPKSWEDIKAHPDSQIGISLLRKKFTVVTLSNGPVKLLSKISKNAAISWDMIIPIEMAKVYKPNIEAYKILISLFGIKPEEIAMVTANETFGDLEAAKQLGMKPILIRGNSSIKNIIELYEEICEQ